MSYQFKIIIPRLKNANTYVTYVYRYLFYRENMLKLNGIFKLYFHRIAMQNVKSKLTDEMPRFLRFSSKNHDRGISIIFFFLLPYYVQIMMNFFIEFSSIFDKSNKSDTHKTEYKFKDIWTFQITQSTPERLKNRTAFEKKKKW